MDSISYSKKEFFSLINFDFLWISDALTCSLKNKLGIENFK